MGFLPPLAEVDPEIEAAFQRLPLELNELGYDEWGFNPEKAKLL